MLIPLFRYALLLIAAIIVTMTFIVVALSFWNQVKELTADEEPAAKQRSAEEVEILYDNLWSWKKK